MYNINRFNFRIDDLLTGEEITTHNLSYILELRETRRKILITDLNTNKKALWEEGKLIGTN